MTPEVKRQVTNRLLCTGALAISLITLGTTVYDRYFSPRVITIPLDNGVLKDEIAGLRNKIDTNTLADCVRWGVLRRALGIEEGMTLVECIAEDVTLRGNAEKQGIDIRKVQLDGWNK